MRFPIVCRVASRGPAGGDDRVAVLRREDHVVIAVADGAGGIGSGSRAADAAVQHVRQRFGASGTPEPQAVLREADAAVRAAAHGGQTTMVLVVVDSKSVTGGSVGDSEAWIVRDAGVTRLTERQQRKPLLGSGQAELEVIPQRLVDLVRLRSGNLPDDLAVAVCRPIREPR